MRFCERISEPRGSSGTRRIASGSGSARNNPAQQWRKQPYRYVQRRKQEFGLTGRETFVPQVYDWGGEAQVDWYEAVAEIGGERQSVQHFAMRSMASGGAFHVAYYHATQQAFLEAHELAFGYFGGVFRRLRYDNLKSAVKKILRGHQSCSGACAMTT
jgi:transposase